MKLAPNNQGEWLWEECQHSSVDPFLQLWKCSTFVLSNAIVTHLLGRLSPGKVAHATEELSFYMLFTFNVKSHMCYVAQLYANARA